MLKTFNVQWLCHYIIRLAISPQNDTAAAKTPSAGTATGFWYLIHHHHRPLTASVLKECCNCQGGRGGGLRVHNCEGGLWGGQKCRLDVLPWVQCEPGIQHSAPPASSFQRINHNCAHILPSPLHLSFLLFAPQAAQMCKIMHLMSLLGYFCKFPAMNYSSLNSWFRQFRHTRTLTWILKLNVTLGVFSVCFSRLFFCQRDSSVKWILWRCRVFVRPGHPSGKFISLVS